VVPNLGVLPRLLGHVSNDHSERDIS
jgi:hypothetical protein